MNMRLQRRCISRRLLVVSLTTVRLACGNSNSFWSWFNTHNTIYLKDYTKSIALSFGEVLRHLNSQEDW